MPEPFLRARRPAGAAGSRAEPTRDPDVLAGYLEDAAHFSGGYARELVSPASEAELAEALRAARTVLPVGAQSSLTGGATPMGDTIVSTRRFTGLESIGTDRVRVGAGVTLDALNRFLESERRLYPPTPTFAGAFVGGTVATNAAGAATFKYGATRDWVDAITVVLASGDVLDIERGAVRASSDGRFQLRLEAGAVTIPVPTYQMPRVPKVSAGYFAAPGMDLIDLFIGSEGTLGVVTAVTLRVIPARPATCVALVPFSSETAALAFTHALRSAAHAAWRTAGAAGIDVSAIDYMDARSLDIVREDGADAMNGVHLPADAGAALIATLELPTGTTAADAFEQIGRALEPRGVETPLVRFCRMLSDARVFDDVEIAVPGDSARMAQLAAVREAVPAGVNLRIGRAKRDVDAAIEKSAADVAVPFDRLGDLLDAFRTGAARLDLNVAVWGHIADGNLHPNVISRTAAEWRASRDLIAEVGRTAIRFGGTPMAEHGVGRNPVKQQLLCELYGPSGIEEMRAVKRALDPEWKLAPGVLFSRVAV